MKKKVEYQELERIGADERQLEAYSNTDPLEIYYDTNKCLYSMTGAIEENNLTAQEVLDSLSNIYNSWND